MLTGYSANLVRAGSHAETGRAGRNGRVGMEKVSVGVGVMGQGLVGRVGSWMAGG